MRCRTMWWMTVMALVAGLAGVEAARAEKVFRLGVVGPFTGPSAKTGQENRSAAIMALEKIDYRIGDYRIEPVWIDSQSDPAKATSAYSEAVERGGIEAGILNWHSSVAATLMDVAAQYRVAHMFTMGAAGVVNEKWHSDPARYAYWGPKGWPEPGKLVVGYAECLDHAISSGLWKPDRKLVAIYGEDTDWGRNTAAAFKREFQKKGWEVHSEDFFPTTQTDFYPLLNKYKKAGVSVLAGSSASPPAMAALTKQASEIGLGAVLIADGLGWVGDWYKLTGAGSNHVLDMIPQLTTPAAKAWAGEFRSRFGFEPSPSAAGLPYDYTNLFIKVARRALEKHGELTKKSVYDVMAREVATGQLTYGARDGALIMKEYRWANETMPDPVVDEQAFYFPVIQYMDGTGRIVYPPDWKEADFEPRK